MKQQKRRTLGRALLWAALLCLVSALLWLGYRRVAADINAQTQAAIKNSAMQCAVQCYAVEGAYPPDVAYLEENYGFVYNKKDYIVSYDAFASNQLPDITVLVRG